MNPTGQLLHYWAREILQAIKDVVYKSTYMLKNRITLDNIYVFDSGLGLYLSDLEFKEECENTKMGFELYEAKCMKNYAQILLDILYFNKAPRVPELDNDKKNLTVSPATMMTINPAKTSSIISASATVPVMESVPVISSVKVSKEERFKDLKSIVDPILFYIVWFSFNENHERKLKYFEGTIIVSAIMQ